MTSHSLAPGPPNGASGLRGALSWACLAAAIVSEVAGSLCLKAALDAPWLYAVVAVGYLTAFGMLAIVLRLGMPLGVAYGIWGACGVALTAVMSWVVFAEPLTPVMCVGIGMVMAGVLCVEVGAQLARRPQLWEDP